MAEAFLASYKIKGVRVKSAGVRLDFMKPFVASSAYKAMKRRGVGFVNDQSQEVTDEMIDWADKIIIVANNVNPKIFPKKKVVVWPIEDTAEEDKNGTDKRIGEIEKKVKDFAKTLNV